MSLSPDTFQYALENTRVVVAPQKRLETFGTSLVNYYLVTEDMDSVNLSRVREGTIHAEKPAIISPQTMAKLMIEGFGEKAGQFADFVSDNPQHFTFLKYGFRFRKDDIRSYDVHEPIETVLDRVREEVSERNDPLSTVLQGVDDGWEVCLLKFMVEMIQTSSGGNMDELRRRGFLP
jgi:hypothetical protein